MAQKKSSATEVSTRTQNEIAFGEAVRARLAAFSERYGDGQSEPRSEPGQQPLSSQPEEET